MSVNSQLKKIDTHTEHNNFCGWEINSNRKINYKIVITDSIFNPSNDALLIGGSKKESSRFIVVDDFIYEKFGEKINTYFHANKIKATFFSVTWDEKNKTPEHFLKLFKELDQCGINRRSDPIIAIGGGVLTDIVGFVASCYRRGVPYIKVPTTLMGYVDASVGIKTGVNFNGAKNRMGSFDAPKAVILDKSFLHTLTNRHILNGVGEILKLAVIKDINLFNLLEIDGLKAIKTKFQTFGEEILNLSIQGMIEELSPNLFEDNLERSVDFGHTFSPALEMFDVDNLLHGEAVAIDVFFSVVLAFKRSIISFKEKSRVLKLMKNLDLPFYHKGLTPTLLWEGLQERTHHRDGLQRVPLPSPLGQCIFVNDITQEEIINTCKIMEAEYA